MHASTFLSFFVLLAAASSFALPRSKAKQHARPASKVDIDAFEKITAKAKQVRAKRLVSLEEFEKMSEVPGTIILDTRSKRAFDDLHLEGAVHLNFSDFTASKLEKVLGSDKTRRILIYCNNNFFRERGTLPESLVSKGVGLALNIPTFINLFGYGYKNVYELGVQVSVDDKSVPLVGEGAKTLNRR